MAQKKTSRLGAAIRKHALLYPETHEDFLIDESYRAIAPKKIVAALPDPPRLP